ncbi:RBBP9/YdeN family alpha/beta hydrolase [Hyalangium rubrum]|uniref:Alpha/beta hydrolase n=1 Tax=Hyalangium rubrum TaxID=3103134 RepID=A0ABU5HAA4_9BACT|nr:alpha/beta hydrolase [Hyalangium sp. s54d21]MDY7229045.1 alpha/beta hydrolase [Hyalangium sp. s54d21]
MERSLFIVPRWAGRPDTDFYAWLEGKLRESPQGFASVRTLDMPNPSTPTIEAWVGALAGSVGSAPASSTVLMGHSVGCQAIIRYLATLPPGHAIDGVVLVAGWWDVDKPWESIVPWIETPVELARVRAAARRFVVLLSDNDPFTADHVRNRRLWEERLGAEVTLAPGGRHFNNPHEPAVLETLLSRFGSSAN